MRTLSKVDPALFDKIEQRIKEDLAFEWSRYLDAAASGERGAFEKYWLGRVETHARCYCVLVPLHLTPDVFAETLQGIFLPELLALEAKAKLPTEQYVRLRLRTLSCIARSAGEARKREREMANSDCNDKADASRGSEIDGVRKIKPLESDEEIAVRNTSESMSADEILGSLQPIKASGPAKAAAQDGVSDGASVDASNNCTEETRNFGNLSPDGLASLKRHLVDEAYLESFSEFIGSADEAFSKEVPPGKSISNQGFQAVVLRLSKRLEALGESLFDRFAQRLDELLEQAKEDESERQIPLRWREAVIRDRCSQLLDAADTVWTDWLTRIREISGGGAYGMRVRPTGDAELMTINSHVGRMRSMLSRVTERYSIPSDLVRNRLLAGVSKGDVNTVGEFSAPCFAERKVNPVNQIQVPVIAKSSEGEAKGRRGRKSLFTLEQLETAHQMKSELKSDREIAKLLYSTRTPSPSQCRGISTILKYHSRSNKRSTTVKE